LKYTFYVSVFILKFVLLGLQTPLFAPLFNSYMQALQKGPGEEDAIAIYKYLQDNK